MFPNLIDQGFLFAFCRQTFTVIGHENRATASGLLNITIFGPCPIDALSEGDTPLTGKRPSAAAVVKAIRPTLQAI